MFVDVAWCACVSLVAMRRAQSVLTNEGMAPGQATTTRAVHLTEEILQVTLQLEFSSSCHGPSCVNQRSTVVWVLEDAQRGTSAQTKSDTALY